MSISRDKKLALQHAQQLKLLQVAHIQQKRLLDEEIQKENQQAAQLQVQRKKQQKLKKNEKKPQMKMQQQKPTNLSQMSARLFEEMEKMEKMLQDKVLYMQEREELFREDMQRMQYTGSYDKDAMDELPVFLQTMQHIDQSIQMKLSQNKGQHQTVSDILQTITTISQIILSKKLDATSSQQEFKFFYANLEDFSRTLSKFTTILGAKMESDDRQLTTVHQSIKYALGSPIYSQISNLDAENSFVNKEMRRQRLYKKIKNGAKDLTQYQNQMLLEQVQPGGARQIFIEIPVYDNYVEPAQKFSYNYQQDEQYENTDNLTDQIRLGNESMARRNKIEGIPGSIKYMKSILAAMSNIDQYE